MCVLCWAQSSIEEVELEYRKGGWSCWASHCLTQLCFLLDNQGVLSLSTWLQSCLIMLVALCFDVKSEFLLPLKGRKENIYSACGNSECDFASKQPHNLYRLEQNTAVSAAPIVLQLCLHRSGSVSSAICVVRAAGRLKLGSHSEGVTSFLSVGVIFPSLLISLCFKQVG